MCNDLLSQNIIKTAAQCQIKWKTLLRSYKNHKDNTKQTGRGQSRFLFFDEMEDLLGSKPSTSCNHVVESSQLEENIEVNVPQSEEVQDTEVCTHVSENVDEQKPQPKKRKTQTITERYVMLKKVEYEKKEARHRERLEVENKKVSLLEKYVKLIEKQS